MGEFKKMCLCGAKNCSGYIGEKAKSKKANNTNGNGSALKKKAKKKVKNTETCNKVWEDLCFRYL